MEGPFKYLGAVEDEIAGVTTEINIRIQRAKAALSMKSKAVFDNSKIRLRTKILMYQTIIGQTTLLDGCATWATTKEQIARLESVQIQCLRKCLGFQKYHHVSYIEMLDQTKRYNAELLPVEAVIRRRRLLFLGHVERMDVSRLPYRVLHGELSRGIRPKGKSERQFRHSVKEDLQKFDIPEKTWQYLAHDKKKWKATVNQGLVTFLARWRADRIEQRNKDRAAEMNRRRARGEVLQDTAAARYPLQSMNHALDERQNQIPAALQYIPRKKVPSIVARMLACVKDDVVG